MFKNLKAVLLLAALFGFATPALGAHYSFSGSIDGSEPTFDQPLSAATVQTGYDTLSFTVDTDGLYSFLSFYPGDTDLDLNMDGALLLYETSFDPLAPAAFIAGDDDYFAGDVVGLSAFDAACIGSNCSGFETTLTAGTTYVLVQTSFTDVPNSFGQPTGDYESTIIGAGAITAAPVPVPAAIWLFATCLAGLGVFRRK